MTENATMPALFDSPEGKEKIAAWRGTIKLIATDVDGTLTIEGASVPKTVRGTLAPEAYATLTRLAARGVQVALVSGRPLATIEGLGMYLGFVDRERTELGCPLIAENGAVYKFGGGLTKLATREPAMREVEAMQRDGLIPRDGCYAYDNHLRYCDVGIDSSVIDPVAVAARLAQRPELGLKAFSSNIMTHIVQTHVSKADALAELAGRMGIAESGIAVFGDSATDISLFERFDKSVCVANYFETVPDWQKYRVPAIRSARPGGAGFAEVVDALFD